MSLYIGSNKVSPTIAGMVDTTDATATTDDIATGKTAYAGGNKLTGTASPAFPPNWTEIGYTQTPQKIIDYFDYAKQIKDNWDSSVTSLYRKFDSDLNLKYMPLVDTSNVTNMQNMFGNCSNLETIPVLNTSNVTKMNSMFAGCRIIETVPLLDTSNVTDMNQMFNNCQKLKTVPLLDTSNVKNMSYIFSNCYILETIPLLNTSNVTTMQAMFYGCANLTTVPLLDTSKVTTMQSMFRDCSNLTNQSLNNILQMCINAVAYTSTKTLKQISLSSTQAATCQSLSNYQAFLDAGWTTGY